MSYNRVDFYGDTLMDVSSDSVSPGTLLEGVTAHNAAGDLIVGTLSVQFSINAAGHLIQTWSSGEEKDLGKVEGEHGVGIFNIAFNSDGSMTVTLTDGQQFTSQSLRGAQGERGIPGNDGTGIRSVRQTSTSYDSGGVNVITITLTDGSTSTFEVRNGSQGSGSTGKTFVLDFAETDWTESGGGSQIEVPAATHGCGTTPIADVFVLSGSSYKKSSGYPSKGWMLDFDMSGNITLSVASAAARFAGRIAVFGPGSNGDDST